MRLHNTHPRVARFTICMGLELFIALLLGEQFIKALSMGDSPSLFFLLFLFGILNF